MFERTRLAIFDWDGTISDSIGLIVCCLQQSAEQVGLPIPPDEQGREIIGLGLPEALAYLFPRADRMQLEELRQAYSLNFVELSQEPPPFYPGVLETLETMVHTTLLLDIVINLWSLLNVSFS